MFVTKNNDMGVAKQPFSHRRVLGREDQAILDLLQDGLLKELHLAAGDIEQKDPADRRC